MLPLNSAYLPLQYPAPNKVLHTFGGYADEKMPQSLRKRTLRFIL
jgi:hypothetical protein